MLVCERVKTSGRVASAAGFRIQGSPITLRLKDLIWARKSMLANPENFWFFRMQSKRVWTETPLILGRGHLSLPDGPSEPILLRLTGCFEIGPRNRLIARFMMARGSYSSTTAWQLHEMIIGYQLRRGDIFVAGSRRCVTFRRLIAIKAAGAAP